jgi:hypothetical protein
MPPPPKYFVLRSSNLENLALSVKLGVWATPPKNEARLNEAFGSAAPVLLAFTVSGSGAFQGYARMRTPIGGEAAAASLGLVAPPPWVGEGGMDLGPPFGVEWMQRGVLPYEEIEHLM